MFHRYQITQKSAWIGSILVLFVLASGIIGYQIRTQNQAVTTVSETVIQPAVTPDVVEPQSTPTLSEDTTPQLTPDPTPEPEPVPMPEVDTPTSVDVSSFLEEPQPVVYPLQGEIISVFSVNELTYNATMDDWRIHDGIDIAAPQGTVVVSACAGTVVMCGEDDLLGTKVVIDHGNGYQTTYANLQSAPTVTLGDVVSTGDIIGAVGTTALADSALEPHLHFSVSYNGDTIDPMDYLEDAT